MYYNYYLKHKTGSRNHLALSKDYARGQAGTRGGKYL